MYLTNQGLVGLYATEWCALAIFGSIAALMFAILDLVGHRSRLRTPRGFFSGIGFAMVVAVAFFLGALAWITTFRHSSVSIRPWIPLLVVLLILAGVVASTSALRAELAAVAQLGRRLSMFGAVSLAFLAFTQTSVLPAAGPRGDILPATSINIVLITIDTLAASHLSLYGATRPTSPRIDEFAARSVVFDRFHASSNFTTASIASIMTGVAPWTNRVLQLQGRAAPRFLRESVPAKLHDAGYLTAYFASNPWAGGRVQGLAPYFDYRNADLDWVFGPCFDRLASLLPYLCAAKSNLLINYSYSAIEHAMAAFGLISIYPHSDVEAMVARVDRWCSLKRDPRRPVFLWVHFFPPHDPYAAPPPWLGRFDHSNAASTPSDSHPAGLFEARTSSPQRVQALEARYDESIAYVDHYIGDLITSVRTNLGPNTAIILSADHGESFNHGYGNHGGIMMYEDLIHVPLIISIPGNVAMRRNDLASQIDIAPTISALAGIRPSPIWQGRSLLDPLVGDRTVFAMNFEENPSRGKLTTGSVAVLRDHWKLTRFYGEPHYPDMPPLNDQLFDLQRDPDERSNLAASHEDLMVEMGGIIAAELARHDKPLED